MLSNSVTTESNLQLSRALLSILFIDAEKKPLLIFTHATKYIVIYRTRAIISRGLYLFCPIFHVHFFVFKEVFSENSVLMYG